MRLSKWMALAVLFAAIGVSSSAQQRGVPQDTDPVANHPLSPDVKGGLEETGPYVVVPDHFKPPFPDGWTWGPLAGIHAESPDRIYVYSRGIVQAVGEATAGNGLPARDVANLLGQGSNTGRREHVLTVYDRNGKLIEDWKHLDELHQGMSSARRLRVNPADPDKHLWLIDVGLNRILKVTREGKVVMTVGPAKRDEPLVGLNGYQDMAFLPNGDFWALESNRVVKFSKDGTQLTDFGKKGSSTGEVSGGFSIAVDRRGRLYVGERASNLIKVFDQDGKLLDTWPNIRFGAGFLALDKNDRLWIASAAINQIAGFDLNGRLLYHWGVTGMAPGLLFGVSQFDVDSEGNVYMVERYGGKLQMFRPKKGANPQHLIAQLVQ